MVYSDIVYSTNIPYVWVEWGGAYIYKMEGFGEVVCQYGVELFVTFLNES